jgi:hypothetical protein
MPRTGAHGENTKNVYNACEHDERVNEIGFDFAEKYRDTHTLSPVAGF